MADKTPKAFKPGTRVRVSGEGDGVVKAFGKKPFEARVVEIEGLAQEYPVAKLYELVAKKAD